MNGFGSEESRDGDSESDMLKTRKESEHSSGISCKDTVRMQQKAGGALPLKGITLISSAATVTFTLFSSRSPPKLFCRLFIHSTLHFVVSPAGDGQDLRSLGVETLPDSSSVPQDLDEGRPV